MAESTPATHCRLCKGDLGPVVLPLGTQPISNRLQTSAESGTRPELYPLEVALCSACGLPQLAHHIDASVHFNFQYPYRSGASSTWVAHCRSYADDLVSGQGLRPGDLVIESGSNDGTLLHEFKRHGCRVLGVEPSRNVAELALAAGIPTEVAFLDAETTAHLLAAHGPARCLIGNNVLAHVPDTDGFLKAARDLVAEDGFLCFEFPHFVELIERRYFDTIYHEHYTYLGVGPLHRWAVQNGMMMSQVGRQPTHGGSLRVIMNRDDGSPMPAHIRDIIDAEESYRDPEDWLEFQNWLRRWKQNFTDVLSDRRDQGKRIAGYAAAAKATVMCNFVGLDRHMIDFCCDASPFKQGRLIPGTGIPIIAPEALRERKIDTVVVFAWNIFDEICAALETLVDRPIEIIRPLPELEIRPSR